VQFHSAGRPVRQGRAASKTPQPAAILQVQNIWRMSYSVPGMLGAQPGMLAGQQPAAQFSTTPIAAAAPTPAAEVEWYEDQSLSANDALKLLVNRIQNMGPVSEWRCLSGQRLPGTMPLPPSLPCASGVPAGGSSATAHGLSNRACPQQEHRSWGLGGRVVYRGRSARRVLCGGSIVWGDEGKGCDIPFLL
jgi:hypothetical protein